MTTNWIEELAKDPKVIAWFNELKSKHPDIRAISAADFIRQGGDYDYKTAYERGIRPELDPESRELHWSGTDLKSANHPTKWKSILIDNAARGVLPQNPNPDEMQTLKAYGFYNPDTVNQNPIATDIKRRISNMKTMRETL